MTLKMVLMLNKIQVQVTPKHTQNIFKTFVKQSYHCFKYIYKSKSIEFLVLKHHIKTFTPNNNSF